ncbi:zinc-binding dehydrogenase [Pseudomonas weihenstephanensis]|uniref:zinc-binding dehydrogenase n=1 Tax=Pseudomonas weihenstephanensis TaxID=1608994 RepID=UPI00069E10D9|nr:zinc-binding dehydrogenase [Pseudomonas weihenstephanensis]
MAAKAAGATTIIAVDVVQSRLDLALELGATHVINSKETDAVEATSEITNGGVEYALASTGIPAVLRQSVDTQVGLANVGVVAPRHPVSFDVSDLLINGKSIRGICDEDSVPQKFIPNVVRLLMQGRFAFDRIVEFYPFDKINEAAADSEKGSTLKPILIIDPTFPMSH